MFGRRGNEASLSKTSLGNSCQCEPVAQSVHRVVMWVLFRWWIVKKRFSEFMSAIWCVRGFSLL